MNARAKFSHMAFGGALVFLGMLGALMSPLTAKNDKFGEIECTKLTVVDAEDGGRVDISSTLDAVRLRADGIQASLAIVYNGKYLARMASDGINGDEVTVNNKIKLG